MPSYWGVVVDYHVLIVVLHTLFNCICRLREDGLPNLRVNPHESRQKANFPLWCLGRRLASPGHELEHAHSDAVPQDIQSFLQVVDPAHSLLRVLYDLGKEKRERGQGDLGYARLVEVSVVDVVARIGFWRPRNDSVEALGGRAEPRGARRGRKVLIG